MIDYTKFITSEYRQLPKFTETVALLCNAQASIADTLTQISTLFDVDTSVGAQLDQIGLWVGLSRRVGIPIQNVFFSFDLTGVGWDQGVWKSPYTPSQGVVDLDDLTYAAVLRAKIASNYWDGTYGQANEIGNMVLQDFGIYVAVVDNFDMSYDLLIIGNVTAPLLELIKRGYFPPKTAGVRLNAVFLAGQPLFGLDFETEFIAGFDEGYFI